MKTSNVKAVYYLGLFTAMVLGVLLVAPWLGTFAASLMSTTFHWLAGLAVPLVLTIYGFGRHLQDQLRARSIELPDSAEAQQRLQQTRAHLENTQQEAIRSFLWTIFLSLAFYTTGALVQSIAPTPSPPLSDVIDAGRAGLSIQAGLFGVELAIVVDLGLSLATSASTYRILSR